MFRCSMNSFVFLSTILLASLGHDIIHIVSQRFSQNSTAMINFKSKDSQFLKQNNNWKSLRAFRNKKIFIADGNQFFNRPGPRLLESLEIFSEIMHPDLFNFGHKESGWINYND